MTVGSSVSASGKGILCIAMCEKTHCFLLSKSGFSDDLIALSRDRDDIRLITGEELFGRQPSASS